MRKLTVSRCILRLTERPIALPACLLPAPRPMKALPPVSSRMLAVKLAMTAGWYMKGSQTPCPMWMRRVFMAAIVIIPKHSLDTLL